ncbi:RNA polymerase sigma factor [Cystobacter ferrugineus]|uniref:RNA polymerase subunit sigma-70 n=1 Tax=Cystobacter ferrugineus TaxID=83449 RepID=A0A1L9BD21_9BACT|nr:sigma-70 family RNA polymerase sigma factor [Cystobacter ferrugineus]OJH40118.1 RNA polymerase subunit sigma-70 [Cystobacter ferrugineus]
MRSPPPPSHAASAPAPVREEALRTLLDHRDRFASFLASRVDSQVVVEELLQAAYVKALEKSAALRDEERAVAWFYRLLRNALTDHYRHRSAEARALEREAREPLSVQAEPGAGSKVCACLHGVLPSLKPEYAHMVRQVDLEEQSVSEVAREAGVTPNNAMVRLHRARQALKARLQHTCGACASSGCLDCSCRSEAS